MVHWDHKRRLRRQLSQVAGLILLTLLVIVVDHKALTGEVLLSPLKILHEVALDTKEVSGLGLISDHGSGFQAIAVGDSNAHFTLVDFHDQAFHLTAFDPSDAIVDQFSICRSLERGRCKKFNKELTSDWEAVAADPTGLVALLQEFSSSVVLINQRGDWPMKRIHLDFRSVGIEVASPRERLAENTLGEGMVLMRNGHIAIAKERFPAAVIEFGPEGEEPLGLHSGSILKKTSFRIPISEKPFVPLKVWRREGGSKCDISELTVDEQGAVYLLSENCRRILYYPDGLSADSNSLDSKQGWSVPKDIKSPEALAITSQGFLVGSDIKSKKPSLFLIERPEGFAKENSPTP